MSITLESYGLSQLDAPAIGGVAIGTLHFSIANVVDLVPHFVVSVTSSLEFINKLGARSNITVSSCSKVLPILDKPLWKPCKPGLM